MMFVFRVPELMLLLLWITTSYPHSCRDYLTFSILLIFILTLLSLNSSSVRTLLVHLPWSMTWTCIFLPFLSFKSSWTPKLVSMTPLIEHQWKERQPHLHVYSANFLEIRKRILDSSSLLKLTVSFKILKTCKHNWVTHSSRYNRNRHSEVNQIALDLSEFQNVFFNDWKLGEKRGRVSYSNQSSKSLQPVLHLLSLSLTEDMKTRWYNEFVLLKKLAMKLEEVSLPVVGKRQVYSHSKVQ